MADYLFGVVAAEMPAAFEEEALKAQACAARTYTVVRQASAHAAHPQADVCTDSSCCQAYVERQAAETRWGISAGTYSAKISQAVTGTDGLGILYQGAPIQAVFFSSAPGQTADAVEVWGSQVDYLKSVSSPEGDEVPNYRSQVVLTAEEVRSRVLAAYPGAACPAIPPAGSGPPPPTAEWCPASRWGASPSRAARCAPCFPCAPPPSPWPGMGQASPFPSPAMDTGWA